MFGLLKPAEAQGSAHDFSFVGIGGTPLPLSDYDGKAILVVNTASRCGFTPQYDALQGVWERYRDQGLVVLGIPSNDFRQELATEEEIAEFCEVNFDIDFPMAAITAVTGADRHPFYRWAGQQVGPLGQVRWNFHKFLIGPDGGLIDWFSSLTSPSGAKMTRAIEAALEDASLSPPSD